MILARYRTKEGALVVAQPALDALEAYAWPGNIRELDNVISVAAALCQDGVIELFDLPEELLSTTEPPASEPLHPQQSALKTMLAACDGNISEAARRLGVDRSTVHRQMKRYGLNLRT
jgi:transcriptional regulator of acetoin/glycerol metabolism